MEMQDNRELVNCLQALVKGDFEVSMGVGVVETGENTEAAWLVNELATRLRGLDSEIKHLKKDIADEGKFGGQIEVHGSEGAWAEIVSDVNAISRNLKIQVRGISRVITARANGDLTLFLTTGAKGEIQELEETINVMGRQLETMTREMTRISREIGSEKRSESRVDVPGLAGAWQDLAWNFNTMADTVSGRR